MFYFGDLGNLCSGFLREESTRFPMYNNPLDDWFGMDPGGGDVKDAAAQSTSLLTEEITAVKKQLEEYLTQTIEVYKEYSNTAVAEYKRNVQQGMTESDALYKAGLEASNQMANKAYGELSAGAKAATDYLQSGFKSSIDAIKSGTGQSEKILGITGQQATQAYQEAYGKAQAGLEAQMGQAPGFNYDASAYRNSPEYNRQKEEGIQQIYNQAARSGVEDQAGVARQINDFVSQLDYGFQQQAFGQAQQTYQNQLAGYQTQLGAQGQLANMQTQQGAGLANIYQNQGQNLSGIYAAQGSNKY